MCTIIVRDMIYISWFMKKADRKVNIYYPSLVSATGPGNPPAVRFMAGGLVRFSSPTGQKPDPHCVGGVVTATGYIPAGFGQVVPRPWFHFYSSGNIGSNEVFDF
jgi:hypothetical protein